MALVYSYIQNLMKKTHLILILTPVLYFFAWPPNQFYFLISLSLVPLLYVSWDYRANRRLASWKYLILIFGTLFFANISVVYWISKTSLVASFCIYFINSSILIIPFFVFVLFRRNRSKWFLYLAFTAIWISVEFLHSRSILAFPFLNLGYSLSGMPKIIQFYEYTGIIGGSLWIIICNILSYELLAEMKRKTTAAIYKMAILIFFLLLPVFLSLIIYQKQYQLKESVVVSILHYPIKCHEEKYALPHEEVTQKYLESLQKIDFDTIDFLIFPETALTNLGLINQLYNNSSYILLQNKLLSKYKNLTLVAGGITYEEATDSDFDLPNTMRDENTSFPYKAYNSVLQFTHDNTIQLRVKKNLVPIEETIPDYWIFKQLRNILGSLGGFYFSSNDELRNIFETSRGIKYFPSICYESLFGDLVRNSVKEGASLIFISLNECWYSQTAGVDQFLVYASCRAIENRKPVIRSSNLGYSSFTDIKGNIIKATNSLEEEVIIQRVPVSKSLTFYAIFGDIIGYLLVIISFSLIIMDRIK